MSRVTPKRVISGFWSITVSIVTQSSTIPARELMEERKCEINAKRRAAAKSRIDRIDESLSPDLLQAVQQTRDKGASSWLNAIPIEEHGLALNKQEFRDSLCLRYNLPLPNLPSYCACGEMFTVNHALSCKKGGFVAQRHDTIRDILTSHISKVCRNVETEPLLQPLDNEVFNLQSTVTSRGARLNMKAGGFCTPGVTAFFDVRVTHVNSRSNQGKYTSSKSKKTRRKGNTTREWWELLHHWCLEQTGAWDYQNFLRTLANKLSTKNNEAYASVISWLRIQLSLAILRTVHRCVRGSRYPFKSRVVSEDFTFAVAGLHLHSEF